MAIYFRAFSPIVYDEDNSAPVDFIENRMPGLRSAHNATIAAKTEQSHYVNLQRKDNITKYVDSHLESCKLRKTSVWKLRKLLAMSGALFAPLQMRDIC